jgi:hypothetical protein
MICAQGRPALMDGPIPNSQENEKYFMRSQDVCRNGLYVMAHTRSKTDKNQKNIILSIPTDFNQRILGHRSLKWICIADDMG